MPSFFFFGTIQFGAAAMSLNDGNWSDKQAFTKPSHFLEHDPSNQIPTLTILKITFYIIQIMIQTPMIIDGLRRCSNSIGSQG